MFLPLIEGMIFYGVNANTKVLSAFPRVSNALTFARRFKVDLPPGVLFYPQCGNDSGEVLLQFMDSVSEFHFINRDEIPVLPVLDCRRDREVRSGSGAVSQYVFPSEIVTSARTLPRSHHSFWYQAHVYQGGAYDGQEHTSYASTNEIWTVASNLQNRVRVHSHRFDELESLKAVDSISVFFCPGPAPERIDNSHSLSNQDAPGSSELSPPVLRSLKAVRREEEYTPPASIAINDYNPAGAREERRSLWFTPKYSVKVLDKLTNGGIIIAGACPEARCDLLWRRLGRQTTRLRDGSDRNRRPENFTYANRRFRCLGECGHRFGPVFAWQVFRLS